MTSTASESAAGVGQCSCAILTEWGPTAPIRILRVGGEIDASNYHLLHAALNAAVFGTVDEPTVYLLVDLSQVTFCSAGALGLLHDVAASGDGYQLCGMPDHLARVAAILWPEGHPMRRHARARALTELRIAQSRYVGPDRDP